MGATLGRLPRRRVCPARDAPESGWLRAHGRNGAERRICAPTMAIPSVGANPTAGASYKGVGVGR